MKTLKYMLIAACAILALAACSDDDSTTVSNPKMQFCAVNDTTIAVSQLTFTKWSSFQMVDIQSNIDWQVSCDADWITLSNHSGVGMTGKTLHLKVTVAENPTEQSRTANITLTGNGQTAKLAVVQNATYVDPLGWISAEDAVSAMKIGLNLYNTMEAYGTWFDWTDDPIETFQTCWGNPLVTADWFNAVKANGFNAVRIPVTWFPHTDENFQVTEKWMNRVEEVVKYGLDAGLYVILNVHHDTGGEWLAADLSNIDEISEKYVNLWTQIATRFEKYDDHLMFESYNEILDENKQWVNAKGDAFIAVNQLAQTFVNTIRSLGENNQHRNLIVNTYAANGSHEMLDPFVIPTDQIPEHLMVQVHNYDPAAFCKMTQELKDGEELPVWTEEFQNELAEELDILIEYYNANHVPIIIGEFAANDKIAEEERAKYAEFMVTYCRSNANISLFYWNEIISRTTFQPTYPTLMNALLKAKDY
jgi:endoglucanase